MIERDFQGFCYRQILLDEFEVRIHNNPSYSLRAYARDLQLSPSRLVDVLGKRYGLSEKAANSVGRKLLLNDWQLNLFCALVEKDHARSRIKRALASKKVSSLLKEKDYNNLDLAIFQAMSSWYYFAIVELTYLKNFHNDIEWISKKLNIKKDQASEAIHNLCRIGLLRKSHNTLESTEDYTHVGDNHSSVCIKKYHLELLEKARCSLLSDPVEEREFLSLTMSMDSHKINLAKEKLNAFLKDFCNEFSEQEDNDEVYSLCFQFFKLS